MTAVPPIVDGGNAIAPVRSRRCVRHATREAVARCPACGGFFCRECVVEHEGRLLCATCLAREAANRPQTTTRWPAIRRAALLIAAGAAAWASFYFFGTLLLRIPPEFHDATVWSDAVEGTR